VYFLVFFFVIMGRPKGRVWHKRHMVKTVEGKFIKKIIKILFSLSRLC